MSELVRPIAKISAQMLLPYRVYTYLQRWRSRRLRTASLASTVVDYLNRHVPELRISLLDVGARLGLKDHGLRELLALKNLHVEGIEPDAAEAQRLSSDEALGRYRAVHPVAVYDTEQTLQLYLTALKGCSSVKKPREDRLRHFTCSSWFTVVGGRSVDVVPLSSLFDEGTSFDFIKIDVQGAELEVLRGGGGVTAGALGLIVEVQFREIYEGQALFPDIHSWMVKNGFHLIRIDPYGPFYDGEIVEADCVYVKSPEEIAERHDFLKRLLFAAICENRCYVQFLLREYASVLAPGERELLLRNLGIQLNEEKLALLGPHN